MKIEFTVKKGDQEIKLVSCSPTNDLKNKIQAVRSAAFAKAIKEGSLLKAKVKAVAIEQNVWSAESEQKYKDLILELSNCLRKVPNDQDDTDDEGVTLADARTAAIRIRELRNEISELTSVLTSIEANTAEKLADNEVFDYLVANCTFTEDGKKYFKDLTEYKSRTDEPDAYTAASKFAFLYYSVDENYEKTFPENAFLLRHKLCNDELSLVDKDGKLVDKNWEPVEKPKTTKHKLVM